MKTSVIIRFALPLACLVLGTAAQSCAPSNPDEVVAELPPMTSDQAASSP